MRHANRLVASLAVIALLGATFLMMPRGYDTDLSSIGGGRPAAVLVHDPQYIVSMDMMESLNRLRGDFEPDVLFLLADVNVPQGRKFAQEQSADFGTLVLFDADGRRLAAHSAETGDAALRALLEKHYR